MNFKEVAIGHNIQENNVNTLFFSQQNVDALQHGIRYTIYKKTGEIISNQNDRELQVIMRSIYLQYSKNLEFDVLEQIRDLNKKILDMIIPKIIIEMSQYRVYLKDASQLPTPIDRGENTSTTGTKFLVQKEF